MNFIPDLDYIRERFFWHYSELYTRCAGYSVVLSFLLFPVLLCHYAVAYFTCYENSSHFPVVSLFSPVTLLKEVARENDK